ncbi:MAG: hypothetical protein IT470_07455 [Pseudomonadales bacterium]|nr:hypothetical protein [Pseudomonadales bacterium]
MTDKPQKSLKKIPKEKTDTGKALNSAQLATSPSINAAAVIEAYGKTFGEQNLSELILSLRLSIDELKENDLSRCENMLLSQAHALQAIFTNLSRRAINQEYMKHFEAYLRMALKAQNQCRMTLETLATIKNPPIVYAKQANIAQGHQQVNNGASSPSHAEKNQTSPNELLEADAHEQQRLDTRASGKAGRADKAMAALDKSHRRKNG